MRNKENFGMKANPLIALSEEERKKGRYQNLKTLDLKDREKRMKRKLSEAYEKLMG